LELAVLSVGSNFLPLLDWGLLALNLVFKISESCSTQLGRVSYLEISTRSNRSPSALRTLHLWTVYQFMHDGRPLDIYDALDMIKFAAK
jgi:hypothetical protein